jgi:hypothetical protein
MEIDMIDTRLPRFKISSDVLSAVSIHDIMKTARDMKSMNIYDPPFQKMSVHFKARFMEEIRAQLRKEKHNENYPLKMEIIFDYEFIGRDSHMDIFLAHNGFDFVKINPSSLGSSGQKDLRWMASTAIMILIVLLATKNIQKNVEICNKPNSRNRREQTLSKYSSTTTISIGKISKTMRSADGTGGPVRPHLRRGHIRNQPYGTGNSEVKRVFIQPMFVNADQGWIDTQKEYRVTA